MTIYLGDFAEDDTVHFHWNTFDSNDPSASVTRATDGTISVYKDGGTTQSTAGVTDTEDFDSLTGVHYCAIDTSSDAFYATGSEYSVVLSGASIDGGTVNAVIAQFSIERAGGVLALIKAGNLSANVEQVDGQTASATGAVDFDDIAAILTDTGTTIPGTISTAQADLDTITGSDGVTLATAQGNYAPAVAGDAMALAAGAITDASLAGNMEIVFETDFATNYNTTRNAWVTNLQDTVGTGNLTVDVVAVSGNTTAADNLQADYDGTGYNKSNSTIGTCTTNTDMRGTDSAATAANLATVDAIVDNLNLGIIYGAAATGTLSTTQATSDLTGYANDQLIGRVIIFTSGDAEGEATDITDYASASGLLTFTALTTAPADGDTFKIV